jgi:uroporphyrinogen-III synthase
MGPRPLSGRRVVTTRDERGRLDSRLAAAGADVVHVPLISIESTRDGRLDDALRRLDSFDWLVVTSQHGASRVGAAAADVPVRLAAVGTHTAEVLAGLAGRPADVIPDRQTAVGLLDALRHRHDRGGRVLVAQADRAHRTMADGLAELGFEVEVVTAYHTVGRTPTWQERRAALSADAVGFASGSAAEAWADAIGTETPPVVAAIGQTTADAAIARGLKVTEVAADHDVEGLVAVIVAALARQS